jgi:sarcosine oxidase subunit gamma
MASDTQARDRRRVLLAEAAFTRASGANVTLRPLPFQSLVNLRGDPGGAFSDAVRAVTGIDVPLTPNTWTGARDRALIWLGPDEWLLVAPDGEAADIEARLRGRLSGHAWLSIVDVSSNYAGFALAGTCARDVLAKGCSLDLDARAFAPGSAAQTTLAQASVLLTGVGDDIIEIRVRNSFARYLLSWLDDAMAEYRE